jgi:hypothetical protein
MGWGEVLRQVASEFAAPVLVMAATGLGGWVLTLLPGPLRTWLQSATHQRDVALVLGAMTRRALAIQSGAVATASPPLDLAAYARQALPEVLAKLAPTDETLRTMALAAMAQAQQQQAPSAAPIAPHP